MTPVEWTLPPWESGRRLAMAGLSLRGDDNVLNQIIVMLAHPVNILKTLSHTLQMGEFYLNKAV